MLDEAPVTEVDNYKYGYCSCGHRLLPVWFTDEEYHKGYPTGRTRRAVSHLECPWCFSNVTVDDSFDGPWV